MKERQPCEVEEERPVMIHLESPSTLDPFKDFSLSSSSVSSMRGEEDHLMPKSIFDPSASSDLSFISPIGLNLHLALEASRAMNQKGNSSDGHIFSTPQQNQYLKQGIRSNNLLSGITTCSSIVNSSPISVWSEIGMDNFALSTPLVSPIMVPESTPRNVVSGIILQKDSSSSRRKSLRVKKMNISGPPSRGVSDNKENENPQQQLDDSTIFSSLKELRDYDETSEETPSPDSKSKDIQIQQLKQQLQEQEEKYDALLKDYNLLKELYDKQDTLSDTSSLSSASSQPVASVRKSLRNIISFGNAKFIKLFCRVRNYTPEELEMLSRNSQSLTSLVSHFDNNTSFESTTSSDICQIEDINHNFSVLATEDNKIVIRKYLNTSLMQNGQHNMSKYEFQFDKVFGYNSQNDDVTLGLKSFMERVVKEEPRQRFTVMAYGATGSGKTYTIKGLMEHVQSMLFDDHKSEVKAVSFNCFEIYNEQCVLLLNSEVEDFVPVETKDELNKLISDAQNKRKCAETEHNKRSSRSHCIYRFKVDLENDGTCYNILNVIDLAGSEKLASDDFILTKANQSTPLQSSKDSNVFKDLKKTRTSETVNINKSLSVLSQVIKGLAQGSKFVNYRDSILTKILKHDLSQVALIVTVKPPMANKDKNEVEKIINSLTFAKKATAFDITKSK